MVGTCRGAYYSIVPVLFGVCSMWATQILRQCWSDHLLEEWGGFNQHCSFEMPEVQMYQGALLVEGSERMTILSPRDLISAVEGCSTSWQYEARNVQSCVWKYWLPGRGDTWLFETVHLGTSGPTARDGGRGWNMNFNLDLCERVEARLLIVQDYRRD